MAERRRGSTMRSIALFVAGMLVMGVFALVPATAHVGNSSKHLFKHTDGRYVRGMRFGQIKMNVGDPDRVVAKIGPFTWIARCETTGGADDDIWARLLINTSMENSAFESDDDDVHPFGPADNGNPPEWAEDTGAPAGGAMETNNEDDEGWALAPNGTSVFGQTAIATNFAGAHCVFSGYLLRTGK